MQTPPSSPSTAPASEASTASSASSASLAASSATSAATPVIVIAPDSFKGSLGARGVAEAVASGLKRVLPDAVIRICPMADGGEGTLEAFLTGDAEDNVGTQIDVTNAAGGRRVAPLALLGKPSTAGASRPAPDASNGGTAAPFAYSAIIESAEIVGITDPEGMGVPVAQRSSLGIGEALLSLLNTLDHDAAPEHTRVRVFVALGGSSTNDGGAGMLCALGAKLLDTAGQVVPPAPYAFGRIARIDLSGMDPRLSRLHLVAMSDVDNPLCGEHGATAIFGPQKGVEKDQVAVLDAALSHFADCLEAAAGKSQRDQPGAGAAGGLGYALLMLGASFRPGAEVVAEQMGLDAALTGADWLITGEGRSDAQTLRGKAPYVACRHARALGVATTLLSGAVDRHALPALGEHFTGCVSIAPGPITLELAIQDAAALLADAAEQLARVRYGR